jgi:outer membrane scaffolding protein for murein synthesis (MipA/OmpV family)
MDTELSTVEKTVTADTEAAKSWLSKNWQYATAIAAGGLTLGVSIGMKFASHLHG